MRTLALIAVLVPFTFAQAQQRSADNREYMTLDRSALEDSLMSIPSSMQRASATRRAAQTDDRATLLMVMRVARTIPSSEDRSRLLEAVAPRYLSRGERPLVDAFFRTARTVPSSEELRDLMIDVVPYAAKSDDIANAIIEVARIVPSSPDRSDVLTALVQSGAIRTSEARENFADALRDVPSEQDRQRVARAAAKSLRE